jgi:hypothetical protein
MERIGILASKIAKKNLGLYNLCVVFLAFLFSVLIFCLAGAAILLSLVLLRTLISGLPGGDSNQDWSLAIYFCLTALAVVVGIVNTIAIMRNIKLRWGKKK